MADVCHAPRCRGQVQQLAGASSSLCQPSATVLLLTSLQLCHRQSMICCLRGCVARMLDCLSCLTPTMLVAAAASEDQVWPVLGRCCMAQPGVAARRCQHSSQQRRSLSCCCMMGGMTTLLSCSFAIYTRYGANRHLGYCAQPMLPAHPWLGVNVSVNGAGVPAGGPQPILLSLSAADVAYLCAKG